MPVNWEKLAGNRKMDRKLLFIKRMASDVYPCQGAKIKKIFSRNLKLHVLETCHVALGNHSLLNLYKS